MRKGLEQLPVLSELSPLLEDLVSLPIDLTVWEGWEYDATKVNENDPVIAAVEEIADHIVQELNRQNIISGQEKFLESYVPEIAGRAQKM